MMNTVIRSDTIVFNATVLAMNYSQYLASWADKNILMKQNNRGELRFK